MELDRAANAALAGPGYEVSPILLFLFSMYFFLILEPVNANVGSWLLYEAFLFSFSFLFFLFLQFFHSQTPMWPWTVLGMGWLELVGSIKL